MLRALAVITFVAAALPVAHADGHLAGAPAPNMTVHSTGDCRMETSTETVHGVRVQRSTPVGCEQPRRASMATASVSRDVDVTVKTRVVLAPRRYGTSPFVVGSPDWRRARTRGTGYVLGAPRP